MTPRLTLTALACITLAAPASAADRFYRLDPATWALYSVTRSLPAILAPDGTTVIPFQAGAARGTIGPAGYVRSGSSQTGLYVAPGGADEFSIFYKNLGGDHAAHICIDGYSTGYPVHQCLDFDGTTGAFTSASQAIVGYSIAPVLADHGWYRVSIAFRTAAKLAPGTQAFPYVQANPDQRFALWRGFLITGQQTP